MTKADIYLSRRRKVFKIPRSFSFVPDTYCRTARDYIIESGHVLSSARWSRDFFFFSEENQVRTRGGYVRTSGNAFETCV